MKKFSLKPLGDSCMKMLCKSCFFIGLLMTFCLTACSDDDDDTVTPIFPEKQNIVCNAGEKKEFTFTANTNWSLASSTIWCKFQNNDTEITFNREDVQEPLVEMDEQLCASTATAFGTIYGDGKLLMNQPTAYTSYFSTNENFVLQYVTLSVNNRDGSSYGTVGTFVNVIEWISEAEAEKLKEQGY